MYRVRLCRARDYSLAQVSETSHRHRPSCPRKVDRCRITIISDRCPAAGAGLSAASFVYHLDPGSIFLKVVLRFTTKFHLDLIWRRSRTLRYSFYIIHILWQFSRAKMMMLLIKEPVQKILMNSFGYGLGVWCGNLVFWQKYNVRGKPHEGCEQWGLYCFVFFELAVLENPLIFD